MFTKCKFNANGTFNKWKARLAARGDQQESKIFQTETSSPTANMASINMLLDHGVQEEYDMFTSDVPGAYLHADINEVVVLRLPRSCATIWLELNGIPGESYDIYMIDGYVYVILGKALYGLVQSSYLWFQNIKKTLEDMGFIAAIHDPCIYY